jgi:3-mercaptopyruvate sulfurtransferase SseA
MDNNFITLIDGLHKKYQDLISMPPVTVDTTPSNCPVGGVYLFSEHGKHLYAGRTKCSIRTRLKGHVSTANNCPFAWHLAREKTGIKKATYKKEGNHQKITKDRC